MAGKKLDPIVSEFDTEEEAKAYDLWFRKKVQAALDDERPDVPHGEAMAHIKNVIRTSAKKRA